MATIQTQNPNLDPISSIDAGTLAGVLGRSTKTLERWRENGSGPDYYMSGREPRYRLDWASDWQQQTSRDGAARG